MKEKQVGNGTAVTLPVGGTDKPNGSLMSAIRTGYEGGHYKTGVHTGEEVNRDIGFLIRACDSAESRVVTLEKQLVAESARLLEVMKQKVEAVEKQVGNGTHGTEETDAPVARPAGGTDAHLLFDWECNVCQWHGLQVTRAVAEHDHYFCNREQKLYCPGTVFPRANWVCQVCGWCGENIPRLKAENRHFEWSNGACVNSNIRQWNGALPDDPANWVCEVCNWRQLHVTKEEAEKLHVKYAGSRCSTARLVMEPPLPLGSSLKKRVVPQNGTHGTEVTDARAGDMIDRIDRIDRADAGGAAVQELRRDLQAVQQKMLDQEVEVKNLALYLKLFCSPEVGTRDEHGRGTNETRTCTVAPAMVRIGEEIRACEELVGSICEQAEVPGSDPVKLRIELRALRKALRQIGEQCHGKEGV